MEHHHGNSANEPSTADFSRDDGLLVQQGKRPQLKRGFSFLSMLGFTTTMLISWEAIFFVNPTALEEAGPVGLFYGFIFGLLGTLATAASMAELASIAPLAGAQYHWVAMLAPEKHRIFISWLTGWLAVVGWQAFVASGAYLCATIIQGIAILNYDDYSPTRWQGTLIFWAVLLLCGFVNTVAMRLLPLIETFVLVVHILAFFGILIPLTTLATPKSPHFVFETFFSLSGWTSPGLAWFIGLTSAVFPFLGYDGPCHMSEEVKEAERVVPWCMITGVMINGVLAFAMVIVLLFTIGDVESVLNSKTGYDFIQVFFNTTKSKAGATAMSSILVSLALCATIDLTASASRITWAFARDRGLPFSKFFAKVHQPAALPLHSIALTITISALLALINIGSTAAFNAIVSVTIAGLSFSYFVPIALLAYKRSWGSGFQFGPWQMGSFGLIVNVFSLIFLLLTTVFSFFPTELPVTLLNFNWSCVVAGGAAIFGLVYYFTVAQNVYRGPIVEVRFDDLTQEICVPSLQDKSTFQPFRGALVDVEPKRSQ